MTTQSLHVPARGDRIEGLGSCSTLGRGGRGIYLRTCRFGPADLAHDDVLEFTLHGTSTPNFHALVEKIRLREISLVPNPVNPRALVLDRRQPSAASAYAAARRRQNDLLIAGVRNIQKRLEMIQEVTP